MGSMEDVCVVCADQLSFAGLGPCGHKEVCARCVSRMRFVLKDNRCVLCQQESPHVYFTRFNGDYTQRVSPEFFASLKDKAAAGEVYELPAVKGYFDDERNYLEIKKLCSYTHPVIPQNEVHEFQTLQQLKTNIDKRFSREFCPICLKARKVFICEQLVYTKKELERHMTTGDETGALAESGFKGHPNCRFCRTRFYGSEDLWKHMESNHENCFICRRVSPEKYVYYRNYGELEEHYKKDHHLCPHPSCLEQKFVVFLTEGELKRHFAQEHGDELRMSRAQRREALTLPIQFQYRSGNDEPQESLPYPERPGVVIGGGAQVGSRVARRGRNGRQERQEPGLTSAIQASMETLAASTERRMDSDTDTPSSLTFTASDFPSVSNTTSSTGIGTAGRWAGGQAGASGSLNPEEFPSLPSMSRADKRRAKKDEQARKTLAERLSSASQQPRVLHRAVEGGNSSLHASDFPSLQNASTSRPLPPQAARAHAPPTLPQSRPPPDPVDTSQPPGFTSPPDTDSYASASTPSVPPAASVSAPRPSPPGFPRTASGTNIENLHEYPTLVATSRRVPKPAPAESKPAPEQEQTPAAVTGVSGSLKAANKALIEKVKKKLLESEFAEFRKRSGDFMKGQLSAQQYHDIIVDLGLLSLAADMVALCPDADLRGQLMAAHKEHIEVIAAAEQAGLPPTNGWMPIEAAWAAASEAEAFTSWTCAACTLINAPQATHCEVCGLHKSQRAPPAPAPSSSTSSSSRPTPQSTAWRGADAKTARATTPPPVVEDFPSLASGGNSTNSDWSAGSGSKEPAEPSTSTKGDKKKKKGKQSTSLGTFLHSNKPAPATWGNAGTAAAAVKSSSSAVGSSSDSYASASTTVSRSNGLSPSIGSGPAPAPAPRGQWSRNGGAKLAKQIGVINDAWGR